ncbi:DUF5053 domain-containing protein [Bacteroides caecimuris]|jgi:hypothetical protein|uniref:DUF5053 domain-containing protein n=1 Tax=Bacteroides caecimuris TaxID=1796613 RepID=UPI002573E3DC|nr:DUF5053 domain-containing protein [Bacteroides caecimuris]
MDKVKRFFELKELWKKSSEEERIVIDQELSALMELMNEKELESLTVRVEHDFERMREEEKDIQKTLTIRQQLEPILPYISVSSLAKDYFGKSTSWFYQRLNGNIVHGKTAAFTDKELNILKDALKDVASKLNKVTIVFS